MGKDLSTRNLRRNEALKNGLTGGIGVNSKSPPKPKRYSNNLNNNNSTNSRESQILGSHKLSSNPLLYSSNHY